MNITGQSLKKMLFIDIETVSAYPYFEEVPQNFQQLWALKCQLFQKNTDDGLSPGDFYMQKAGIYSEFAKVVCISVGFFQYEGDEILKCKIKSFAGDDEKVILKNFSSLLENHYNNPEKDSLCGHNIKEFDIPFLCRRMVIHRMPLPKILDISGKKPWQTAHICDTMDMWRFGDYKNYTSLNLLSAALGIETPKDDIDGSMVGRVYWEEKDLPRIAAYCQKDVITVMQIMRAFAGQLPISPDKIDIL